MPMSLITITEALADLKTIEKRMAEKQRFAVQFVARPEVLQDPLLKDGGSEKLVSEALQAFNDLAARHERIRVAVMGSNLATMLTLQGETRSVFGWLTWRREIAQRHSGLCDQLANQIKSLRQNMQTQTMPGGEKINATVALSEVELQKRRERVQLILGELDGQLSLLNATTKIDV